MKRVGISGRLIIIVCGAVMMACNTGLPDVLVTKSGTRYQGQVTDKGNWYVLTKPGGGKMTFPKSMVREVFNPETSKPQYEKMLKDANLIDDAQVAKLVEFAAMVELTSERRKLLSDAYAVRLAAAKGNASRLRALAKWCTGYSLNAQAKKCRLQANMVEFPAKLVAAGNDTTALVNLSNWCRANGLKDEAVEVEQAALRMAPDDAKVRGALGYIRNKTTGKWIRLPRLPAVPAGLNWAKDDRKLLEEVARDYPSDPVSAYLTLKGMSTREKDSPTATQKKWLQDTMAAIKSRTKSALERDIKVALRNQDLRGYLIVVAVASKVDKRILEDVNVTALKSLIVSNKTGPAFRPVWKVGNVKGSYLKGSYGEGSQFALGRFTVSPKPRFRLFRVMAEIKNVSLQSDLPYIGWALSGIKRVFSEINPRTDADSQPKSRKPSRLALDEFMFLLTPGGDWISCGHVCEGSSALRGVVLRVRSKDGTAVMIFPGSFVEQGSSFKADILFSVPQGVDEFRLLVLGSTPVPVAIVKDGS